MRVQRGAVATGAAVGALGMTWAWLLQTATAAAAERLWAVSAPQYGALYYPVAGAVLGALVGLATTAIGRPLGWSTRTRLALTSGAVALMPASLRLGASVERQFPRPGPAWIVLALFVVALLLVTIRLLRRRPATGYLCDGTRLAIASFSVASIFHLVFLMESSSRFAAGFPVGLVAQALLVAAASVAALVLPPTNLPAGLRRLAVPALIALVIGWGLLAQRPVEEAIESPLPEGPNVLLIVLDTLRRDAVSAYGLTRETTPHLDRLAQDGVLWEDTIVPGNWTIPGHASLFTGAVVTRHGAGTGGRQRLRSRPGGPDTPALPTLAELLTHRGWHTRALVNNPNISRANGFDRGFQRFEELWTARRGDYDLLRRVFSYFFDLGVKDQGGALTVRAIQAFLREIQRSPRPWLLFINFLEPHAPYNPPAAWRNRFTTREFDRAAAQELSRLPLRMVFGPSTDEERDALWQLYLGDVAYQDHLVGEVLAALDSSGFAADTIVIATSDHGETFGWNGQFSHGIGLNDDLLRVPLIAVGPGIPSGVRDRSPTSLVDLLPTILALTASPPQAPDPGCPGVILPPLGPPVDPERQRVAERYEWGALEISRWTRFSPHADPSWGAPAAALLEGPWKVVSSSQRPPDLSVLRLSPHPPTADGRVELDDVPLREALLAKLVAIRASWPHATDPPKADLPELDEETRRRLEALGYVDN